MWQEAMKNLWSYVKNPIDEMALYILTLPAILPGGTDPLFLSNIN